MLHSSKLKEMFEASPSMAAITMGPEHRIEYANATLRGIFGSREYLNRSAPDIVEVAAERKEIRAYLDTVYRTGAQLVRRAVALTFAGSNHSSGPSYYDALYHPLYDERGEVVGIFVEGHDVTARVALESMQPAESMHELPDLTDRQRAVLAGIMAGLGNKQIAHRLGVSDRTAEMHRQSLLRRLGFKKTSQLVAALAVRPDLATLATIGTVVPSSTAEAWAENKAHVAKKLIEEIVEGHRALSVQLSAFETLVRQHEPERADFIEARYTLTQASLRRRATLRRATDFLMAVFHGDEQSVIRRVGLSDDALLKSSSAHTAKWTTSSAMKNWENYQVASSEIRGRMRAQIELESALLLPLLMRTPSQNSTEFSI